MSYTNPTVSDFQAFYQRDFPFGNLDLTTVNDLDIGKALVQMENFINPCLFMNQNSYTQGALALTAHWLVINLRASSQGIAGKTEWITQSKSVGPVSTSLAIPDRLLENPEFAWLVSTTYGTMYLIQVLPALTGQMFVVAGATVGPVNGIFSGVYGRLGPWNGQTP